jgi:dynein heavy chain, axonemal
VYTKEICNILKNLYQEFRPYLPIITGLKNVDFKIRHFEILRKSKEPSFEIEHDLSQSLSELERMGVMELVDKITEISEIATKEKQLEHQLTKMRDEWKSVKVSLVVFGQSETYILQGI